MKNPAFWKEIHAIRANVSASGASASYQRIEAVLREGKWLLASEIAERAGCHSNHIATCVKHLRKRGLVVEKKPAEPNKVKGAQLYRAVV